MRQVECSSRWPQLYFSNVPEKNEKLLSIVKIEQQI